MQEVPDPFGPLARRRDAAAQDPARAAVLADLLRRLEDCRRQLDERDLPLAAAHVDMAVHVLAEAVADLS